MDFVTRLTDWYVLQFEIIAGWVYQIVVDLVGLFILLSAYITYKSALATLKFSVDVALSIIEQLNFSSVINSYYEQLPTDVYQLLNYVGFPAATNIILSAMLLKFVMGKLGGLGV